MNPLLELTKQGQSIWLDYIRRGFLTSGDFKRLMEEDGIRGVTSNPSIFEKAIDGATDYDEGLRALVAKTPRMDTGALYDCLTIEDVRMAADLLRRSFDLSRGADGYVSIEPPPQSTKGTEATIKEVLRLWDAVNRPNLMVKVVTSRLEHVLSSCQLRRKTRTYRP